MLLRISFYGVKITFPAKNTVKITFSFTLRRPGRPTCNFIVPAKIQNKNPACRRFLPLAGFCIHVFILSYAVLLLYRKVDLFFVVEQHDLGEELLLAFVDEEFLVVLEVLFAAVAAYEFC